MPVHPGAPAGGSDVAPELTMVTNRSAVGGVVAVRREDALGEGAFTPGLDRLALADMTARLRRPDRRIVHSPYARLRLITATARAHSVALAELARLARPGLEDRYYNRLLWRDRAAHVVPRRIREPGLLGDRASLL
jgi:hypothetical protein